MVKEVDLPDFSNGPTKSLPLWATEDTLLQLLSGIEKIEKIQDNISKLMVLTTKKIDSKNNELFDEVVSAIKQGNKINAVILTEEQKKKKEEEKRKREEQEKRKREEQEKKKTNNFFKRIADEIARQKKENKKYDDAHKDKKRAKDIIDAPGKIAKAGENAVISSVKSMTEGSISGVFKSLSDAITGILANIPLVGSFLSGAASAALGAVGYVVSTMETQSRALADMANFGAGLSMTSRELSDLTGILGVDIAQFAKVVVDNSAAMLAFGESVDSGTIGFKNVSKIIHDNLLRNFNQFGMGNSELLDAIAKEADLRRRTGESAVSIQNKLNSGMENLLYETSAMANLTGIDRRELLRARQERAKQGTISSYAMNLTGNEKLNYQAIGQFQALGPIGKIMADALQMGKATGTGIQGNRELNEVLGLLGPGIGDSLRNELQNLYSSMGTISTEEFDKQMVLLMGKFSEEFKNTDRSNLEKIATYGTGTYQTTATAILEFGSMVQGFPTDMKDITKSFDNLANAFKDNDLLSLPASIDDLANIMKASMYITMLDSMGTITDTLGINTKDMSPAQLAQAVADAFKLRDIHGNMVGVGNANDVLNGDRGNYTTQQIKGMIAYQKTQGIDSSKWSTTAIIKKSEELSKGTTAVTPSWGDYIGVPNVSYTFGTSVEDQIKSVTYGPNIPPATSTSSSNTTSNQSLLPVSSPLMTISLIQEMVDLLRYIKNNTSQP